MAVSVCLVDTDVGVSSPEQGPSGYATPLENSPPQHLQAGGIETLQDGSDDDEIEAIGDAKLQEKRRIQKEFFQQHVAKRASQRTKEELKRFMQAPDQAAPKSIKDLMARAEGRQIIKTPRDYQLELFERAKSQNTIAVLDTGSGKTLIAVLLLRHIIDEELESRAAGKEPRVSFFLVDSVALVFQQYAVLDCNLDQKIGSFWGDLGCDSWNRATWQKAFTENMVIVCTAEILRHCLGHSFISMRQINLLIFDEAHHAKKDHPFARIVKDYYTNAGLKPRIFGMTASPVDTREKPKQAAERLERLLDSRIATASDLSLLQMVKNKPEELIIAYSRGRSSVQSGLYKDMQEQFEKLPGFLSLCEKTRNARIELGDWCADLVWRHAFGADAARKMEQHAHRTANKENRPTALLDIELETIRKAAKYVAEKSERPLSLEEPYVSDKLIKLHDYLCERFERPTDAKCIIFVERKSTARALERFLKTVPTTCLRRNLRHAFLIGSGSRGSSDESVQSVHEQLFTVDRFRKGQLNCLTSTSVAEEGLDIPDCNIVIRFDLFKTVIQYVQSRGRARHHNSHYLHFVEENNRLHLQQVKTCRAGEELLKQFCATLPEDRLLTDRDPDIEREAKREQSYRKYVDPQTGATLSYHNCMVILDHFVSTLPHPPDVIWQPEYHLATEDGKFVYEVILPQSSPLHSAIGRPCTRKAVARRSAAFEACLKLRGQEHLDANLLSVYHKLLPEMRNAHLALNDNKKDNYPRLIKPSIWKQSRGAIPQFLFATVLGLNHESKHAAAAAQPLLLLTRTPLPEVPSFPLFLNDGEATMAVCTSSSAAIAVTNDDIMMLNSFTLRIYADIFNKHWKQDPANMSYWVAPARPTWNVAELRESPGSLIDWPIVALALNNVQVMWTPALPTQELLDKYIIDPWNGGRRWISQCLEPDMKPQDPVPAGVPRYKWNSSILDYSNSMFKNSRERAKWLPDQPVFRAERVPVRINFLENGKGKKGDTRSIQYLCPEPLRISVLPVCIVATAYLLPSIITRLESYLIALEGCASLGLSVKPEHALEALTKDSNNTHEHGAPQIHLQRGMGKNYERLEFLGDSFLKMATTVSIFSLYAEKDEFEFHVSRMVMICNANLLKTASDLEIYKYIRSVGFGRRTWYFEGVEQDMQFGGRVWTEDQTFDHHLGGKTIADVAEALIGAALLAEHGSASMDMAVKAVTTFVRSSDHDVQKWNDYYPIFSKPEFMSVSATVGQMDLANQVAQKMGYQFKHPRLLRSAFIHPSYPFAVERIPCYQRLEFLGDALLDMATIDFLFHRNPDKDPQWLTEHKMAMVSNKFLAALSVKLGFHKHMRYNGAALESQIRDYVIELRDAELDAKGAMDYWMSTKLPPKALSDLVESYVGALFVDCEYDYKQVEIFFERFVQPFFEDMSIYDTFANNHPTTLLHNTLALSFNCLNYRLMAAELPAAIPTEQSLGSIAVLMIHNTPVAEAVAESARRSKVKASINALKIIPGMSPYEFRVKYGCDCTCQKEDVIDEGK